MIKIVAVLGLLLLMTCSGCEVAIKASRSLSNTDLRAYQAAERADTHEAYEKFMAQHPESEWVPYARRDWFLAKFNVSLYPCDDRSPRPMISNCDLPTAWLDEYFDTCMRIRDRVKPGFLIGKCWAVMNRPNVSARIAKSIALNSEFTDEQRMSAVSRAHLPPALLAELAAGPTPAALGVASNFSTPQELLIELAKRDDSSFWERVAGNPAALREARSTAFFSEQTKASYGTSYSPVLDILLGRSDLVAAERASYIKVASRDWRKKSKVRRAQALRQLVSPVSTDVYVSVFSEIIGAPSKFLPASKNSITLGTTIRYPGAYVECVNIRVIELARKTEASGVVCGRVSEARWAVGTVFRPKDENVRKAAMALHDTLPTLEPGERRSIDANDLFEKG